MPSLDDVEAIENVEQSPEAASLPAGRTLTDADVAAIASAVVALLAGMTLSFGGSPQGQSDA